MQQFLAGFHSIWSVVVLLVFLGIVAWAYSSKRRQSFEETGRALLHDDDSVSTVTKEK